MRKIEKPTVPNQWGYTYDSDWIGNDRCENIGELEQLMIDRRYDLVVWAEISDKEASYSYDDWALVQLDKDFYLLATSGCSCPSPSETWYVNVGPLSLGDLLEKIQSGDYAGYSVPGRQMQEFLDAIEDTRKALANDQV